jgi:predicted ATPase/predicted negative regulator of RcsB-dependent stress response
LGQHRLKDLQEPEVIYQVLHPQLGSEFPPLKSIHTELTNLPVQLTSFIGREREIAAVRQCLLDARLVTLTGAGGCGKTRLAVQAAADKSDDFPDGVWFVDLAEIAEGALVAPSVAAAIGVRESADGSLARDMADFCRERKMLILMDNCEHVIDDAARVAKSVLQNAPGVCVLATSREPLGVSGESVFHVPSLTPPNPDDMDHANYDPVEFLTDNDAARLFVERATAVSSTFSLGEGNARSVAQVCYQLDGIPLAIELAAARVKVLPIEQIATRLEDRFRLLTAGSRSHLPRQQTLRALIDWSYDLLEENEKVLLRRFSVFAGGWTLESAEKVCEGGPIESWEVLDLMSRLVDKSLVTVESSDSVIRYGLLQTVRQYGREKLDAADEEAALRRRHLEHFGEFAREANEKLQGSEQADWLNRLERERGNLRAALEFANESDHSAAVTLAADLWRFWLTHCSFSEGRESLSVVLRLPDIDGSLVAYARVLQGAGVLATTQNDNEIARQYLEQCLEACRAHGHEIIESAALNSLGNLAWRQGAYDRARQLYEESLALETGRNNDTGIARAKISLGNVATQQAEYELADSLYGEALQISRRIKNSAWEAAILHNLGDVAWLQGRNDEADSHYKACLVVREELGDRLGMARAINKIGDIAMANGDLESARESYSKALKETRQLGDHQWEAGTLADLGNLAFLEGRAEEALSLHSEALTIRRRLDDLYGIASSLTDVGNVFAANGRAADSALLFGAAVKLREQIGAPMPPVEKQSFDVGLAAAKESLTEARFQVLFEEGKAVDLAKAIDTALAR